MLKKLIITVLLFLSLFHFKIIAADEFNVPAKHAIAVEAETGKILYEKDADTPAGIASITKILTVYIVYKQIQEGKLKWTTPVDISDHAYELTTNYLVSNVPMNNRKYTVKELVKASIIASANSASIALAEKIAGSESKFVDMMTLQLKEWGITDGKLVNASGLNNSMLGEAIYPNSSSTDENLLSAKDVAIIARHLITEFPDILKISNQTTAQFDNTTMHTYNLMLKNMPLYRYGVDGLKTGTTELAGASFVATSTENDMRVISVILNADGWEGNDYARFQATQQLLNYVKNHFDYVTILNQGDTYNNQMITVKDGKTNTVEPVAKSDFKVVIPKNAKTVGKLMITPKQTKLYAPIKEGKDIAVATYKDDALVGNGYLDKEPTIPLVAKNNVKQSFFLKVWWNHFVNYVNEKL